MLTIVTPPASRRLTTLDRVKLELGITGTEQDVVLLARIDEVSDTIASVCRRQFGLTEYLETFRYRDPQAELVLSRFPVTAIINITVDGTALTTDEWATALESGIVRRTTEEGRLIPWRGRAFAVSYRAGWIMPGETGRTLPYDVEAAAIEQIRAARMAGGRDPTLRSETAEGVGRWDYQVAGSGSVPSALSPTAEAYLEAYKFLRVG